METLWRWSHGEYFYYPPHAFTLLISVKRFYKRRTRHLIVGTQLALCLGDVGKVPAEQTCVLGTMQLVAVGGKHHVRHHLPTLTSSTANIGERPEHKPVLMMTAAAEVVSRLAQSASVRVFSE